MNNTNHFGITSKGKLINLGVGANTKEVANLLADTAESVALANGTPTEIVALLNISDLYKLRTDCTIALNNLDNAALGGPVETFGITE